MKQDVNFKSVMSLAFKSEGNSFFIAGGSVRDMILNRFDDLKDVDLFIHQSFESQIMDVISKVGKYERNPFGSLRWFPDELLPFYYDIIIIEKFNNGLWKCEHINDVLNQFDITANAVSFDLKTKEFYNPNNGLLHVKRKELRAVRFDYPEENISDKISLSRNTVLWFRYTYYARKLDFKIDVLTQQWIESNAYRQDEKNVFKKYFFNPDI